MNLLGVKSVTKANRKKAIWLIRTIWSDGYDYAVFEKRNEIVSICE